MSRKVVLVDMGIILAAFLVGGYIYHLMPVRMPVHWGMNGQPDSYAGRFAGVFGLPIAMAVSVFLMIFLPWLDPEDVTLPRHYNLLLVVVPAMLFAVYLWIILTLLGVRIRWIVPVAEAVLFYSLGLLLQNTGRNGKVGLRFSWVMSSDLVWKKTHRLIGTLFKLSGVVVLGGLIYPQYQSYLSTTVLIVTPLSAIVYSGFVYSKEQRGS